MEFLLFLFVMVSILLTILFAITDSKKQLLEERKRQSQNFLRENILKRKLEQYIEQKVRFSKRYDIETLCLQAGFRLSYTEFVILSIFSAILSSILILTSLNNPILALLFLFIGYFFPKQLLIFIRNHRLERMNSLIGPFMKMLLKRYETTKDFRKSLELTLEDFEGDKLLYPEIQQTVLDVQLGVPVAEALEQMARRTGNKYLLRFADYYKIASEVGTEEVRNTLLPQAYIQYEKNRKAKSKTKRSLAGIRREAYIIIGAIPLFALWQMMSDPKYIDFMTGTFIGKIGTAVVVLIFMGAIWFVNNKLLAPLD